MDAACINYKETGFFSQTVVDYLEDKPELRPFYSHRPDMDGFRALLKNKKVISDRDILTRVLTKQYHPISQLTTHNLPAGRHGSQQVHDNISLLKSANTYTITNPY